LSFKCQPWWWRQNTLPKHPYVPIILHCITTWCLSFGHLLLAGSAMDSSQCCNLNSHST
jgi:hypothetical protein